MAKKSADWVNTIPALLGKWNYEKNGELKPCDIKCQSNKKVWWR